MLIFSHTLSSIQYRLSLLSTNTFYSSRILPKQLVHPTSLLHRFASNSIAPNGNTVSNIISPNGNIVSTSIAPNGNIVSYSIAPIGKIVYDNIVDKSNLLLSKHLSYSFPSVSIRHVNGIDFTLYSNLYVDVHHWIISLLLLLRLLVSSSRLEYLSRNQSPSCLSLHPSLTIFRESFRSWNISTHSLSPSSFGSKLSC